METLISTGHKAEKADTDNKLAAWFKGIWKRSSALLVFCLTVFLSMFAVAMWVLYIGNPLVREPENIWGIRIGLVVVAFGLVIAERFLRKNKDEDSQE